MSWDAFQCEILEALGHRVYMPVDSMSTRYAMAPTPHGSASSIAPSDSLVELQRAIARAAGIAPDAVPSLEELPRSPAAKRTLWPRLRRLRAAGHGP